MKDIVITIDKVLDHVRLEGEMFYSAYITIGLVKGNDFYVKLEFIDLTNNTYRLLHDLFKLPKALKIESNIITKERYNITHIVIEKSNFDSLLNVTWECLSDDPSFSLELS